MCYNRFICWIILSRNVFLTYNGYLSHLVASLIDHKLI